MQNQNLHLSLEGTFTFNTQILSLSARQLGKLDIDVRQVEQSDLLVKNLGQDIDSHVALAGRAEFDVLLTEGRVLALEQKDLGQHLVGEGAGHDKRGVTSGTAKVDQTTLGKEEDVTAVGHGEAVDLGLDVLDRLGVGLQPGNVDFDIEVTNVLIMNQHKIGFVRRECQVLRLTANDSIVGHGLEVAACEDVTAAGGRDEDLADGSSLLHRRHFVASHSCLKGIDGIDFGDQDAGAHVVQSLGTALANITKAGHDADLSSNHDVRGTLDAVDERFLAAVEIVELGLGDRVIDVDSRNAELLVLHHAVEVVDTSGSLLRHPVAVFQHLGVLLVNQGGQVTTVIEDKVELLSILEREQLLLNAPFVLLFGLTLPSETEVTTVRMELHGPTAEIGGLKKFSLTQEHHQQQWRRRHGPEWRRCCSWTR